MKLTSRQKQCTPCSDNNLECETLMLIASRYKKIESLQRMWDCKIAHSANAARRWRRG
jgi:hypothetical protein